jgi:RNA-binding protein NOB1
VDRGHAADGPENLEFSSFMFWRTPLPNIDRELQELLVRPWLALSRDVGASA